MTPRPYTTIFMAMVCAAFLARVNPVSTSANPACMNMTRKPVSNTQTKLMLMVFLPIWAPSSSNVGLPATFAVTSLIVPVAVPDGSPAAQARAAHTTPMSSRENSVTHPVFRQFTRLRIVFLLSCYNRVAPIISGFSPRHARRQCQRAGYQAMPDALTMGHAR